MFKKAPEGYRELLVYKKTQSLQKEILPFVVLFPKTKTFYDLADQISRSMRSTTKNIVEGWKRNTTKEYFEFLGFAIGSNSEMMEDLADIATGVYGKLVGIRGIMEEKGEKGIMGEKGEKGIMGREELDKLKFYPLDELLSPAVKLFLKTKEIGFLLYRLQQSLDIKMDRENTRPQREKSRLHLLEQKEANKSFNEYLKKFTENKTP